jgi:hypothetical protein
VTGEAHTRTEDPDSTTSNKRTKSAKDLAAAISGTMSPLLSAVGKHQKSEKEVTSTIELNEACATEKLASAADKAASAKERESNALLLESRRDVEKRDSACRNFKDALTGDILNPESKKTVEDSYVAMLLAGAAAATEARP